MVSISAAWSFWRSNVEDLLKSLFDEAILWGRNDLIVKANAMYCVLLHSKETSLRLEDAFETPLFKIQSLTMTCALEEFVSKKKQKTNISVENLLLLQVLSWRLNSSWMYCYSFFFIANFRWDLGQKECQTLWMSINWFAIEVCFFQVQ